jgi:hypothetical protein
LCSKTASRRLNSATAFATICSRAGGVCQFPLSGGRPFASEPKPLFKAVGALDIRRQLPLKCGAILCRTLALLGASMFTGRHEHRAVDCGHNLP